MNIYVSSSLSHDSLFELVVFNLLSDWIPYKFFFFSYKPLHFMRLLYGMTMLCSGHTYPKCSHRREIGLDPCEINPTQHCEAYSTSGMNEEPWEPWVFATLFMLSCLALSDRSSWKTSFALDSRDSVLCLNTALPSHLTSFYFSECKCPFHSNIRRRWHQSHYLTILKCAVNFAASNNKLQSNWEREFPCTSLGTSSLKT